MSEGSSSGTPAKSPAPRLTSIFTSEKRSAAGGAASASGGTRRSFAPNLAASGKRAAPVVKSESDQKQKKSAGSKKEKQPPKGNKRPQVIQTKGIFSEGVAKAPAKKDQPGTSGRVVGKSIHTKSDLAGGSEKKVDFLAREDDFVVDAKSSSAFPKKRPIRTNDFDNAEQIKRQLADTFIDDIPEGNIRPVHLPLAASSTGSLLGSAGPAIKSDPEKFIKLEDFFPGTSSDAATDRSDNLILMQLPSILGEMFETPNADEKQEKASAGGSSLETGDDAHVLDSFPEGVIGKLQILKNGKVRLKIGEFTMNLDSSIETGFRQDLVAIQDDKMFNLGSIRKGAVATVNVVPDDLDEDGANTSPDSEVIENMETVTD